MTNLEHILKSRDIALLTKVRIVKDMVFSSSHVQMWELDHKEAWALENWCFQTVVLKTLDSPLDSKEVKPIHPKGNQSWIFIGRTDAEVEAPVLWPLDVKSQLIRKDPDAGKDWREEEKGVTGDEMDVSLSKLQETVEDRGACHAAVHGVQRVWHDLATKKQQHVWLQNPCYYPLCYYTTPHRAVTIWKIDHRSHRTLYGALSLMTEAEHCQDLFVGSYPYTWSQ